MDYFKQNQVSVTFPKLELSTLIVLGYSNASFSSNYDMTSQLGFITLLAHGTGSCVPSQFKYFKARSFVRSALAAELITCADQLDASFTLAEELRSMHPNREIPVQLYTDNQSIFDEIPKGCRTSAKRRMLDISATREGFRKREISCIDFVRLVHNLADGLNKSMEQSELRAVMLSSRHFPKGGAVDITSRCTIF